MIPLAHDAKTVVFQASAMADLRVVLSTSSTPQELNGDQMSYHLVLGGEDNMNSWVSKQLNGLSEIKLKIPTPKLLRQDRLQTFWISWDQHKLLGKTKNCQSKKQLSNLKFNFKLPGVTGNDRKKRMNNKMQQKDRKHWQLSIGKGSHIGARLILSIPLDSEPVDFRFVGFSTGWGFQGFFRYK